MFSPKALLALPAVAITLALSGTAYATPTQHTKDVTWITQLAPHVTTPHGADDVTWPQKLGTIECGGVLQIDTYRYDSRDDKATVDALIEHGSLNKPGSAHWTDSSVVLSWKFVILPACESPSPTPTPTPTPTQPVMSPPIAGATLTCNAIDINEENTSNLNAVYVVALNGTTVSTATVTPGQNTELKLNGVGSFTVTINGALSNQWTTVACPVPTVIPTVPATVVAAKVVTPAATLPFTGAPVGMLSIVGGGLLGSGAFLAIRSRKRKSI